MEDFCYGFDDFGCNFGDLLGSDFPFFARVVWWISEMLTSDVLEAFGSFGGGVFVWLLSGPMDFSWGLMLFLGFSNEGSVFLGS